MNKVGLFRTATRYFSVKTRPVIDRAAEDGELRVFITAGEVSGDSIASRLMASLKKLSPLPVRFSGVGGSMMCKQGLNSLFPIEDIAVMGVWELLPHLYKFQMKLKETTEAAFLFQPHVVVTVDSKGFSFRLLKRLRARYRERTLNAPIHFHYVAPSFWAWKGGEERLKGLTEILDHIFCLLPFEENVCQSSGLDATFVGHPVLEDALELNMMRPGTNTYLDDIILKCSSSSKCKGSDVQGKESVSEELKMEGDGEDFRTKYSIPSGAKTVMVLPGSRLQEVTRMLPIFAKAMGLLRNYCPNLFTLMLVAPNRLVESYIEEAIPKWPVPALLVPGGIQSLKYDAFAASSVALCTSGTVTMELQLARLPCLVAYRAHFLTELMIQYKAKIQYISLPNILLHSPVIPEALFQACTPINLSSMIKELIENNELREEQISAAEKVMKLVSPVRSTISGSEVVRYGLDNYGPSIIAASKILSYGKL